MRTPASLLVLLVACACVEGPSAPAGSDAATADAAAEGDAGLQDAGTGEDDGGPFARDAAEAPMDAGPPEDAGAAADSGPDAGPAMDADRDGLDDAFEDDVARRYLPYLAVDPTDRCPRSGIVFRARPHPWDRSLVLVVYDHLFERDCGLSGHPGDDEAFAITVDPAAAPPAGITAMKAYAHQDTLCERMTACGRCAGVPSCSLADGRPIVWTSRDKHATYVDRDTCNRASCLDLCAPALRRASPPLVNAGEPEAPLVRDLTDEAFVNGANGWTEQSLMHVDPWDPARTFGGAGNIAGDLTDERLVSEKCSAR